MHFEIHVPESIVPAGTAPLDALTAVGLEFLADGVTARAADGPHEPGTRFSWTRTPIVFDPDTIEATPAVAAADLKPDRYFVLTSRDDPPRAVELARPYTFRGEWTPFGDDQWLVPVAERLPRDAVFADDGSIRYVVQRRFGYWTAECDRLLHRIIASDGYSLDECVGVLVQALQLNYRFPVELNNILRLFTTENVEEPFVRAIGGAHLLGALEG